MTEYNLKYQQIVHVNIDDVSYELNFVGNVVSFMQNDSRCVKHALISATEGFNNVAVDVSAYVKSDVAYFPIVVLDEGIADHISSYCIYADGVVTLYYDGTEFESYNNTITLIPVVEEDDPIKGITNGKKEINANIQSSIGNETDAREAADNAIINSIGNGTITFTQDGDIIGSFTTNQSGNTTIDLDAGGELPNPVVTRFPTFSGTTTGYIDVSDMTEVGTQYMPIVITSASGSVSGSSITEACKNLKSRCEYDYTNRRIVLNYIDNTYVDINNFGYSFILIPQQSGSSSRVYGITDGLNGYLSNAQVTDNLVTSLSSSSTDIQYPSAKCVYDALQNAGGGKGIYLYNQSMTFGANSTYARLDVSNYVENGVAYCPIVFIGSPEKSIVPTATYNITNKQVSLLRNTTYSSEQRTVTVYVCLIPIDSNETIINGLSNGLSYTQYSFINKSDLVTSITSSSTDTQVPSAKCVYDIVGNIETLLQNV